MNTILKIETIKRETTLTTSVKQKGLIDDIIIAAGDSIALIADALERDDVTFGRTREEFLDAIYQKAIQKKTKKK